MKDGLFTQVVLGIDGAAAATHSKSILVALSRRLAVMLRA